jgi:hypothetical protein
MKLSLIIVFTLCTLILTAQNETENNKRISTSWGYNVHLYKGMFDFKPPIVDTSSVYYPDAYYYYNSFQYISDIDFNCEYQLNKRFSLKTGLELYLIILKSKPNIDVINNAMLNPYKICGSHNIAYIGVPIALYYNLNKFNFGIGLTSCIFKYNNSRFKLNTGQEEINMNMRFFNKGYDYLWFVELNYNSVFKTKNHNFGLSFKTSASTFLLYKIGLNYSLGIKISKI